MRNLILLAGVVAMAVVGGSVVRGDNALDGPMKQMGRALKALGTEAADPTMKDAALKDVSKLEAASLLAKDMTPDSVDKLSGDAKSKALTEFREMIGNLVRAELDLEDAIEDGKADDVKKDLGAIVDIMKAGHKEFRKEDN